MNLSFFMKLIGQCKAQPVPRPGMTIILTLAFLLISAYVNTQPSQQAENGPRQTSTQVKVATDEYAKALAQYVDNDGMVYYRALKAVWSIHDQLAESMARLDPKVYESWNDEKKIAFWINACNGLTLQAIIDHYPSKKGGLFSGLRFP